jgi:hypothetical protein
MREGDRRQKCGGTGDATARDGRDKTNQQSCAGIWRIKTNKASKQAETRNTINDNDNGDNKEN